VLFPLLVSTGTIQQMPIMHCMAIIAAWTFMHTGSILAGGIAAIIAGMVQELSARLFYNHASTHVDPPAMAIAICTLLVNLLMKPEARIRGTELVQAWRSRSDGPGQCVWSGSTGKRLF
jgi:hypothetical protein